MGLSLSLSFLFLACCIWIVYRDLDAVLGPSTMTGSISWVVTFNAVLATRLAVFALAVLLVHAALGLLVWALARLTRAAFPFAATRWLPGLIVAWTLALAFMTLATNALWYPGSRFAFASFGLPAEWGGISSPAAIALAVGGIVGVLGVLAYFRSGVPRLPGRSLLTAIALGAALAGASAPVRGAPLRGCRRFVVAEHHHSGRGLASQ